MSKYLDRVLISYSRGEAELPWSSRDELLDRLERLPAAAGIVDAFVAVGASRPVHLTKPQMELLGVVLEHWLEENGLDHLPPGIFDLRTAIGDHLHDSDTG